MEQLAKSGLWLTAGWTMLHFMWIGGLIGLVAGLGRLALRSANCRVRHGFALLCLAALAVSPVMIAGRIADPLPSSSARPAGTHPVRARALPPYVQTLAESDFLDDDEPIAPTAGPGHRVSAPTSQAVQAGWRSGTLLDIVARYLPWLWLIGAPLALALTVMGLLSVERLRRGSRLLHRGAAPETLARLLKSLNMARRVAIGVCDHISSPILVGVIRPVILLPASAMSGWSVEQLEMVILHELAHLRRWDNLVNFLQRIIESMLFFHPSVWVLSHWVRVEREHCCDHAVLTRTGRPRAYAEMLAALACPELRAAGGAAVAMGEHNLVERIRRILGGRGPTVKFSRTTLGLLGLATIAFAVIIATHARPTRATLTPERNSVTANGAPAIQPGFPFNPAKDGPGGFGSQGPRIQPALSDDQQGLARLQVIDDNGLPIAGAQIGLKVKWKQGGPEFLTASAATMSLTTDNEGRAIVPFGNSRGSSGTVPVFVYDAKRRLGGIARLAPSDHGRDVTLALAPLCRVHCRTGSAELHDSNRPLAWIKARILLPGGPENGFFQHNLMLDPWMRGPQEIEFPLPPGRYDWYTFAEGVGLETTQHVTTRFEVQPGQRDLDLGDLNLPLTGYARLSGQPAPAFAMLRNLKDGRLLQVEDLRGKVGLLVFSGDFTCFENFLNLPDLTANYAQAGLQVIAIRGEKAVSERTASEAAAAPFIMAADEGGLVPIEGTGRMASGPTAAAYGVEHAGTALLIDAQGRMATRVDLRQPEAIPEIERLLGIRAKSAAVAPGQVLLRFIDPSGQPAVGVRVGTSARVSAGADGRSWDWQISTGRTDPQGAPVGGISDEEGTARLAETDLATGGLIGRRHVSLIALDDSRSLAAIAALSFEDLGREINIRLQPACRVRGKSPVSGAAVYVDWLSFSTPVTCRSAGDGEFQLLLPPGSFRLHTEEARCQTIDVRPGENERWVNF